MKATPGPTLLIKECLILVNEIMALAGGASIGLLTAPLGRSIFEVENYSLSQPVGPRACGQRRGLQ